MAPEIFTTRFERDVAHAEMTLMEEGAVQPLFAIVDAQGRTRTVAADFSTEDAKGVTLAIVRFMCAAEAAVAVFHRVEAWMVLGDIALEISPAQSERRIEVLLVIGVARVDGMIMQKVSMRKIERDLMGAVSGLRDRPITDLDSAELQRVPLEGRLVNLLPAAPPTFAERRRARDIVDRVAKRMARGQTAFVGPASG